MSKACHIVSYRILAVYQDPQRTLGEQGGASQALPRENTVKSGKLAIVINSCVSLTAIIPSNP